MSHWKSLLTISFLLSTLFPISTKATTFQLQNNCSYTVWGAALPGGGRKMNPGDTWTITASPGKATARIWARTGCNTTGSNGLECTTGDCGGLLECTANGTPPNTLAEFALNPFNSNTDLFDISLVDGFNVPMELMPISNGCTTGVSCRADLNGQCPDPLRSPGGCNSPCNVFKTDQYCCFSGNCAPTDYSRYFKSKCPEAYSFPQDESAANLSCGSGTNYRVTFCPSILQYHSKNISILHKIRVKMV